MLEMPREGIPWALERVLGSTRAEEVKIMVDEWRVEHRTSKLTPSQLRSVARKGLAAGALLDLKVSNELRQVEHHYRATLDAMWRAAPGSEPHFLKRKLDAWKQEMNRLGTNPGDPRHWINEQHAQRWAWGYAAKCVCRDLGLEQAEREQDQSLSAEMHVDVDARALKLDGPPGGNPSGFEAGL